MRVGSVLFLKDDFGWGIIRVGNRYCPCFGDKDEVALLFPDTTKYQAKKIAKRWQSRRLK